MVHESTREANASGVVETRGRTYLYADAAFVPMAHRDVMGEGSESRQSPWFFYVGDVIDTPEELVTGDGQVVASLERTAFGLTATSTPSVTTTPFRFEGQYADEETGLVYNFFRYYDPEMGRYISADPLGVEGGLNLFAYCRDPVGCVDPFGLHELDVSVMPAGHKGPPITPPSTLGHRPGGFSSGSKTTDARGRSVLKRIPGTNDPTQLRGQTQPHTERQAIEWMRSNPNFRPTHRRGGPLDGGTTSMGGELPPCPMCSNEMREFARQSGCEIHYSWPTGNQVMYDPNHPNDSPKTGPSNANPRVAAFCADYAPNGGGPNSPSSRYRGEQDHMRRQGLHSDNSDPSEAAQKRVARANDKRRRSRWL
jgi:RHS repeat-associated protein